MSHKILWGDIPDWAYGAVKSLLHSLKIVDPDTYHHCLRVGDYSRRLAKDMGLDVYHQKVAEFSGMLHDIGKMGINPAILNKPAKLTDVEMDVMKSHPVLSEEIVKPLDHHQFFADILPAVRGHHERVDGRGYPDKKRGDEVPVLARVILVVDTYDAMGQDRAYRKGLPLEVIYKELIKFSGTQFDEQIVKTFLEAHKHWDLSDKDQETHLKIVYKASA